MPHFDLHAPLPSLPGIFKITFDNLPATIPYLHAEAATVEQYRRQLGPVEAFKIGIVWQGSPSFKDDRKRSVRLTQMAPLAQVADVRLFSLQKGPGSEQLNEIDVHSQ